MKNVAHKIYKAFAVVAISGLIVFALTSVVIGAVNLLNSLSIEANAEEAKPEKYVHVYIDDCVDHQTYILDDETLLVTTYGRKQSYYCHDDSEKYTIEVLNGTVYIEGKSSDNSIISTKFTIIVDDKQY